MNACLNCLSTRILTIFHCGLFFGISPFNRCLLQPAPVKAPKATRRLSARVSDLFKPKAKKDSIPTSPKVEEAAPQLEEPTPVAPLETPAEAEETTPAVAPVEETAPAVEAPPAAPVVAATA